MENFVLTDSTFENPFSEVEQSQILEQIDRNAEDFNALRLEKLEITEDKGLDLDVSIVSFKDFLTTNYAFSRAEYIHDVPKFNLIAEEKLRGKDIGDCNFLLKQEYLANTLCFSCLIQDENSFLMFKRRPELLINSGILAVLTGTVKEEDLGENPAFDACAREMERLRIVADGEFHFHGLMVNDQFQPCACVEYHIENTKKFVDNFKKNQEFSDKYISVKRFKFDEIERILDNEKLTDATQFQLQEALVYQLHKEMEN